ncbi:hypothetical protein AB6A40_001899 [Gnathostoma spinigerum]|uniref:Putative hydroxypyruvate isomerase n=1 Tax=Gnathostoma spinigerum TaxID=75299 RepID=A0ABD6E699_9BILA
MRVVANLSTMYQGVELLERYEKAAAAGFRLVEVALPYICPAESLKKKADQNGLRHVLINAPSVVFLGDFKKGFRGIAALPNMLSEFPRSVESAIHYANILDCKKIHVMAGIAPDSPENTATFKENIRFASREFAKEGIMCLIEPINPITIPGYFLSTYEQAVGVINELNEPNLKLQFDVFHAQQICGRLTKTISDLAKLIGHVQVAQVPDRHEPDSDGEIDYKYIFSVLKKHGDWAIGCEYIDQPDVASNLNWILQYHLSF